MIRQFFKARKGLFLIFIILGLMSTVTMTGTAIFRQILVDALVDGDTSRFFNFFLYGLAFTALAGILFFAKELSMQKVKADFRKLLRKNVYTSIMRRNTTDFESEDTGAYISSLTNDISMANSFLSMSLTLSLSVISGIVGITIMLSYNVMLTFVAIGCALLSIALPIAFSNPAQRAQIKLSESNSAFTVTLKELFNGHNVLSSFNLFSKAEKHFINDNDTLVKSEFKNDRLLAGSGGAAATLGIMSSYLMLVVSGILVFRDVITIGDLVLFSGLSGTVTSGAVMIMQLAPHIRGTKPIMKKLSGIIDYPEDEWKGNQNPSLVNSLHIKDLSFSYKEDNTVLKNLLLELKKNDKIALVGASGCGKSTLAKLLSGTYSNFVGSISYDGIDIKQLDKKLLKQLVTIIPQNTFIFNETIRYNICLGEDFAETDFNKALELSGITKFLHQMPNGVDSACGELGNNLSGGQKQRIAIARALIRNVNFLILDEGVSAIDIETANEIEQELLSMDGLTLLTITHRIKDGLNDKYDRVIKMEDGKIK